MQILRKLFTDQPVTGWRGAQTGVELRAEACFDETQLGGPSKSCQARRRSAVSRATRKKPSGQFSLNVLMRTSGCFAGFLSSLATISAQVRSVRVLHHPVVENVEGFCRLRLFADNEQHPFFRFMLAEIEIRGLIKELIE